MTKNMEYGNRECPKWKEKTYKEYLQKKTDESAANYKEERNQARKIVRQAHQQSWDKLISNVENDIDKKQLINLYAEEQGERFHQDLQLFERRYQGQYNEGMLGDYIWGLIRESDVTYKRKCRKTTHF